MATQLFRFDFATPHPAAPVENLKAVTGMRISNIGNPYKDTPGKGRFAGNVSLMMGRGEQEGMWYIRAFSHDVSGADLAAVAAMRRQIQEVLSRIATTWTEEDAYPGLERGAAAVAL